jgi:hypothetical protein
VIFRPHGRPLPRCRSGRNEAIWWGKWLSPLGGWRFGGRGRGLGGRFGPGMPGPYEVLEDLERPKVQAIGPVNAPLNAEEWIDGVRVGVAEGREWRCWIWRIIRYFGVGGVERFVAGIPEFGLDAAESALGPLSGDEGIDEG